MNAPIDGSRWMYSYFKWLDVAGGRGRFLLENPAMVCSDLV